MTAHQLTTTPLRRSRAQILSAIIWPSFLVAGAANSVFFIFFDPQLIAAEFWLEDSSAMAIYSSGFFCFWALTLCSSACTHYLLRPVHNSRQKRRGEQP